MDSFAEYDNAYLRGRMAERKRCAEIALRWTDIDTADTKLGAGWRTSRDLALAARVARGIADEIIATIEDKSDE